MASRIRIDETTKVAALLDAYPELEAALISMAPPFKKLRNPVLRRSVAKVASLRQAAAVARMPAVEFVNRLRAEVGQAPLVQSALSTEDDYLQPCPAWFDPARVVDSIDKQTLSDDGPLAYEIVIHRAADLAESEIVELKTDFLPAPGIDAIRDKGFLVWTNELEPGFFHTYVRKRSC